MPHLNTNPIVLFPFAEWQEAVLADARLSSAANLILSLPTGSGKTVMAELVILKEILATARSCILVLPFVSIVQEKASDLRSFYVFEETETFEDEILWG